MQGTSEFLAKALPKDWFTEVPEVRCDRDELLVIGRLPEGVNPAEFRENTRAARMGIASLAEAKFGRRVSWGVRGGGASPSGREPQASGGGGASPSG
ncbi:MAG TPA: hypothetical protein VGI86_07680, partial [Acidimicrobiia bacterium]